MRKRRLEFAAMGAQQRLVVGPARLPRVERRGLGVACQRRVGKAVDFLRHAEFAPSTAVGGLVPSRRQQAIEQVADFGVSGADLRFHGGGEINVGLLRIALEATGTAGEHHRRRQSAWFAQPADAGHDVLDSDTDHDEPCSTKCAWRQGLRHCRRSSRWKLPPAPAPGIRPNSQSGARSSSHGSLCRSPWANIPKRIRTAQAGGSPGERPHCPQSTPSAFTCARPEKTVEQALDDRCESLHFRATGRVVPQTARWRAARMLTDTTLDSTSPAETSRQVEGC